MTATFYTHRTVDNIDIRHNKDPCPVNLNIDVYRINTVHVGTYHR